MLLELPGNGQKTRSRAKVSAKLNNYFVLWYYSIFIKYYSFIYPVNTRIFFRAQVINKLFFLIWTNEWCESRLCAFNLMNKNSTKLVFNLEKAARGQVTGYIRTGAASKRGKARTKVDSASVGMPLNIVKCFMRSPSKYYIYGITTK